MTDGTSSGTDGPDLKEILKQLQDHESRIKALEGKPSLGHLKGKKPPSIKEFILLKNPHDEVQLTLAIAFFKEASEHLDSFNVRDLEDGFRKAKEQVPLNINDKVNMNIKNGHLMEASEKKDSLKAWTLTNSGERFVENNFEKTKD
jgi:hypothetical protein